MADKRFSVRFGDEAAKEVVRTIPRTNSELLDRAMALLEELRLADFLPEEFHDEHKALEKAWKR